MTFPPPPLAERAGLIRYAALVQLLGLSRGNLDKLTLKDPTFPPRIRLRDGLYVSEDAVIAWLKFKTEAKFETSASCARGGNARPATAEMVRA